MGKGRLEAFSDGVLAIIITIMVLDLRVPASAELSALKPLLHVFLCYALSFVYLGTYWNNHHHMLHTVKEVSGPMLWANLHLLFWLSLFPFVTAWTGENRFQTAPTALYGFVLLMAAVAYYILAQTIIAFQGGDSLLKKAVGRDWKGKVSLLLYLIAIPLSYFSSGAANGIYIFVALMWLVPDPRIEHALKEKA
ncbi:MAG: DUF1211 domain-containing protein [Elusimicrobia bacterium]|nr:DUF1211 domain-containing protein [Elusimicrobiota bacterium]